MVHYVIQPTPAHRVRDPGYLPVAARPCSNRHAANHGATGHGHATGRFAIASFKAGQGRTPTIIDVCQGCHVAHTVASD